MSALVTAAKKEGTLNVIALPADWANYGTIIKDFTAKYGIKVTSIAPSTAAPGSDPDPAEERHLAGSGRARRRRPVATPARAFRAVRGQHLVVIPAGLKDSSGLFVGDYGGYMSVGYNPAKFGTITSLSQLLGSKFKNDVALNGNPTQANAALNGVMMASLAQGGSAGSIADGVNFFHQLKAAGNFNTTQATGDHQGRHHASGVQLGLPQHRPLVGQCSNWKVFIPANATLGGFYYQAINKNAPHPAAARLWEEFLFSQAAVGGQNLWLAGGARPSEQVAMTSNGTHQQGGCRSAAAGDRDADLPDPGPGHRRRHLPGGELAQGVS